MNSKKIYEQEYNKALLMLDNVKSLGVDVSSLTKELSNFDPKVISLEVNKGGLAFQREADYKKYLSSLRKFQSDLKEYEILFNINNSTSYLKEFIKKDLSNDDVKRSSTEVIKSLEELKKCDGYYSDELKQVIDSLISIVYDVIKLEFIYIGNSSVLDYVLKEKIFIVELNRYILEETQNLKTSVNYINGLEEVKNVMFLEGKNGIETHYVNKGVFKALVVCSDYDKVKEHLVNTLASFREKSANIRYDLIENVNLKEKIDSIIKDRKRDKLRNLKGVRKRLAALILSSSILGAGTYLLRGTINNSFIKYNYFTTTTTVTEDDGIVKEPGEYIKKLEDKYQVKLEVSNVYNHGFFKDNVSKYTYDVTDKVPEGTIEFSFDDFSYLDLRDEIDSEIMKEFSRRLTDEEKAALVNEYKYIIIEQDLENKEEYIDSDDYYFVWIGLIIIELIIFVFVNFLIFDIEKLPKEFKEYISSKKYIKLKKREIIDLIEKCMNLISSSDELKLEFDKFCKENEVVRSFGIESINSNFNNIEELKLKLKK